jgi:hypothetical protein
MIFTKPLKYEDITKNLDKYNDIISLIGCKTCVRVAGTGGSEVMKKLALKLRKDGFNVKDGFLVPTACNPKLLFAKLGKDINTIISLTCSAGSSNITRNYPEYKLVQTSEDAGLMVTDTDKNIIKITMPYENFNDKSGFEYETLTGNKTESNNNLPIMEVGKKTAVKEAVK